ncbi:MAG: ABC transporter ATP-binding protein/permease, partial [Defluviitaleaceae bacterium]|nr:ABC transporter ATP-binding protein/permease [Defluviitaleaceae bacterium]
MPGTVARGKYSVFSNILFSLRLYWQERKSLVIYGAAGTIARVALPFTGILMPKVVIDQLTGGAAAGRFCAVVGGMALLLVILNFIKSYTDTKIEDNFGNAASVANGARGLDKLIDMDYELVEDTEFKKIYEKAMKATQSNHTMAANMPRTVSAWLVNAMGLILYGSVISMIHPAILLFLAMTAGINWLTLSRARKYELSTREERTKMNDKLWYASDRLGDKNFAKDIRMYSMFGWFQDVYGNVVGRLRKAEGKVAGKTLSSSLIDGLLILLRDGAAYAYLVYLLINSRISLGDFVLIFAAIGAFAGWVSGLILQTSDLARASSEISDFRAMLDFPDVSNRGPGAALPSFQRAPEICLKNVSYQYSGADKPTLENINLRIKPGERIAVVGANGAGKTTLVKLICGLYRPTAGSVTLNGADINEFNRDEYFSLITAVFQDIHLLADSIAGNVSQQLPEATDRARAGEALRLAGLGGKVDGLKDGIDTMLVRQVNADAIELSGGELQKLALARALYKEAPVIILDEPTAALDPIAENEMYQQYAKLTEGKTSVYISHRLASTRFCDRIIFIDGH